MIDPSVGSALVIQARQYLEGNVTARPVALEQVPEALRQTGGLLWLDVGEPTEDDITTLVERLALNELLGDDLRNPRQRTKLERYGDSFHVAVRDCTMAGTRLVTREIDFVFGAGWLLTVRHPGDDGGPAAAVDEIRLRFERQRAEHGSDDEAFLLWAALDLVVDRYFDITDAIDERLDDIEEIIFDGGAGDAIPREVFELRRALVGFRRIAAPLREVLSELLRRESPYVGEAALVHLHDVFDHVLRIADLVESQRDLLTGLLEAHLAVVSNRMNQAMKLMSSWGAIILGSTLIAGIYGMNFEHMPELHWAVGYPLSLGAMACLTFVLYRLFRNKGWL